MKILVSRTDSIGDVILTLPLCGWIKQNIPDAEVHFLCQQLTVEIIKRSTHIDQIHVWDGKLPAVDAVIHVFPKKEVARLAKKDRIKVRIGTSHRIFHLTTCNKLINFSRINSDLHEAQLNFRLLRGLGVKTEPTVSEAAELIGWTKGSTQKITALSQEKFNLIFHIKSRGSAKEWEAANYLQLAKLLPSDTFNIILTGTEPEGELIREEIPEIFDLPHVSDTTGKLNLNELISMIEQADALLACSTGPLHIAAVSGIKCLGLYPKQRPMHAGRWGPIGLESAYLEETEESQDKLLRIDVEDVKSKVLSWTS